ncbi:aminotransferase class I/II-fold pyridoxal phosphate-dependent enzyme [Nocardioides sp. zg-536]|uniref:Aminotransferase class I/II-fold pyridoxal phosphate-dependent enzyme n=1 Tax=Nocardioides faecalis TaxID=2803858 RepID=A0A938Y2F9_9ACTN|nr:aminotransferase class I/II-fold pyridoxal phosphate-dependent enzyme [Nocardioides faecalis]QVI59225.1 aminotransferase class I/II-fold pyridoxal phosphate-dependent enzyme [Nocardioides faecalis]
MRHDGPVTSTPAPLSTLSAEDLAARLSAARADYESLKEAGLKLDLTRGKPGADQLDLSNGLLGLPTTYRSADGTDLRNYGGLDGLPELRAIFADLLAVDVASIVAGGNSSLTLMHQALTAMLLKGGPDSPRPWKDEPVVRFVCPVPGYDRHFTMLAELGIEMVSVPMNADGPDVEAVRALVTDDPSVKGMWIVPTYANPTGATCSPEVAEALMSMPTAAPDFRVLWDNAYAVHHLTDEETVSADALGLAAAAGNPNRPILFASTSKITFAGAGVAVLATSPENRAWYLQRLGFASIGPDKLNQLRHVEFFTDADGVRAHMRKHRDLIAPKFGAVEDALASRLDGLGIARWSAPTGGYFVNLDVLDGTATRVVALAKEAGIALTPAGSAFPYGNDPDDRNIRLAPTFPVLSEVQAAMAGVAVCVELAALEKLSA